MKDYIVTFKMDAESNVWHSNIVTTNDTTTIDREYGHYPEYGLYPLSTNEVHSYIQRGMPHFTFVKEN